MKKEFGAVEAAGSDRVLERGVELFAGRRRTRGGFVLPPGFVDWGDFLHDHPHTDWRDPEVRRRLRWEPETRAEYVKTDDPDGRREYDELRKRFAADTSQMAAELRKYLQEHCVEALVNPRSSKGLSARQRELPKVKILLSPLFLHSGSVEEKGKDRMRAIPGVAECLMHFSEDGMFQLSRFHSVIGRIPRWISEELSEGVFEKKDEVSRAYQQRDFRAMVEIIGAILRRVLQGIDEYQRNRG